MSVAVRAVPASQITTSLTPNMKEEEQKTSKTDNLDCEMKENVDVNKDLIKEVSEKPAEHNQAVTEAQGDDNACLKSDSESTISPNDQVEKERGDESLSQRKQQLLRSIDSSAVGERKGPKVQILSLSVLSPGRPDVVLPIPFPATTSKATLFTLKEGSKYRIKFHFTVSEDTVNCLNYTYMVWKAGIRVHQTKKIMGTFSPRQEPHTFELEEGTTPTGFFARGPFLVRSKFVDDDGNCYLDTTYYFDIRKDWGARDKCSNW